MAEPRRAASGHQRPDLDFRRVAAVGLGVALMLALALTGLWLGAGEDARVSAPPPATAPDLPATAPPLEVSPAADLEALRRRNRARLDSYGWVDRQAGIAHIPIERAMAIVAEHGLPSFGRKGESPAREPPPNRGAPP